MSGATGLLILVGILALAVFLVVLGIGLSRRAQRREPPAPPAVRPRLRDRLAKTRAVLAAPVQAITGRGRVDEDTWDDVEEALLRADVGVTTTTELLEALRTAAAELRATEPAE